MSSSRLAMHTGLKLSSRAVQRVGVQRRRAGDEDARGYPRTPGVAQAAARGHSELRRGEGDQVRRAAPRGDRRLCRRATRRWYARDEGTEARGPSERRRRRPKISSVFNRLVSRSSQNLSVARGRTRSDGARRCARPPRGLLLCAARSRARALEVLHEASQERRRSARARWPSGRGRGNMSTIDLTQAGRSPYFAAQHALAPRVRPPGARTRGASAAVASARRRSSR